MGKREISQGFKILQAAVVCVFAGRAYQHLFWDAPYREIIWDPAWTGGLVAFFTTLSWDEFVTHPAGDVWIQRLIMAQGLLFFTCAVVALFVQKTRKWGRSLLLFGAFGLIILAVVYTKDKFFHVAQFFEYSLQFGAPILLFYFLKKGKADAQLLAWAKVAIAVTFASHGLYALGYYPYPNTFLSMTENILGTSREATLLFLNTAGLLDFIAAVGVFLPKKWGRAALVYCAVWGLLTALARIVGNFYWDYPVGSLHQWAFEAVYRAPHFLVPWWVWKERLRG